MITQKSYLLKYHKFVLEAKKSNSFLHLLHHFLSNLYKQALTCSTLKSLHNTETNRGDRGYEELKTIYHYKNSQNQCITYLLCNGSGDEGTCLLLVSKKSPPIKLVVLLQTWVSSISASFLGKYLIHNTFPSSLKALNTITRKNPTCHFEITMASNSLKRHRQTQSINICLFSITHFISSK